MEEHLSSQSRQQGQECDRSASSTDTIQNSQSVGDALFEKAMWLASRPDPEPTPAESFHKLRRQARMVVLKLAAMRSSQQCDAPDAPKLPQEFFKLTEEDCRDFAVETLRLFHDGRAEAAEFLHRADIYMGYAENLVDEFDSNRSELEAKLATAGLELDVMEIMLSRLDE